MPGREVLTMRHGTMHEEIVQIKQHLQEVQQSITEAKKTSEGVLALAFLAAIAHAGVELYSQAGQLWEGSPLFLDVLNLAAERAKASFVQAEIRRQAS